MDARDETLTTPPSLSPDLIDFPLPRGLRLSLSSLATPNFATSYNLGTVGVVDGSISYLYSSLPLTGAVVKTESIPLPALLRSYRRLHDLSSREHWPPTVFNSAPEPEPKASGDALSELKKACSAAGSSAAKYNSMLLYGRLYLPLSMLEGLVVKRLGPSLQVQLSAVSAQSLRDGGTLLGLVQYDKGKYGVEGLASTDGGFLGVRGLYNFGGDASPSTVPAPQKTGDDGGLAAVERERIYGRFSAGGELYYGTLNKSGGISLGARFATLPSHRGSPLTATLTINPLMGNISATYAVVARHYCSLATRMEFNVYSYESEWAVGMELWSRRQPAGFPLGPEEDSTVATPAATAQASRAVQERSFQARMEWRLDHQDGEAASDSEEFQGVLKARLDQNLRVGLLWEGRLQSLVFSLGSGIDLQKLGEPFRSVGLDIQYSS